jgi:predicted transcriptional regulator
MWFIDYKPKEVNNMDDMKMGVVESRFADIIWRNEPLHSRDLVMLCQEQLNWKKPTTYTVLRKLCERGLFQNVDGMVSSLISRKEYYAMQSEKFVEDTFQGSLPAFFAAFTTRKTLSAEEIAEIRSMIDSFGEG